jgi:hypothetical protein
MMLAYQLHFALRMMRNSHFHTARAAAAAAGANIPLIIFQSVVHSPGANTTLKILVNKRSTCIKVPGKVCRSPPPTWQRNLQRTRLRPESTAR